MYITTRRYPLLIFHIVIMTCSCCRNPHEIGFLEKEGNSYKIACVWPTWSYDCGWPLYRKRSGDHKISHLVPNTSSAKSPTKFARCTSNLTKFAVILSEKASKGRFFVRDQLQNHTNEGKGKEKKKERGGRKEEKRKKEMVALLVFIMATLEIVFGRKKAVGPKKSIWR